MPREAFKESAGAVFDLQPLNMSPDYRHPAYNDHVINLGYMEEVLSYQAALAERGFPLAKIRALFPVVTTSAIFYQQTFPDTPLHIGTAFADPVVGVGFQHTILKGDAKIAQARWQYTPDTQDELSFNHDIQETGDMNFPENYTYPSGFVTDVNIALHVFEEERDRVMKKRKLDLETIKKDYKIMAFTRQFTVVQVGPIAVETPIRIQTAIEKGKLTVDLHQLMSVEGKAVARSTCEYALVDAETFRPLRRGIPSELEERLNLQKTS